MDDAALQPVTLGMAMAPGGMVLATIGNVGTGDIDPAPSADEIVTIACQVKPDEATLVPERRQELTTEGGLDVVAGAAAGAPYYARPVGRAVCQSVHVGM